MRVHLRNRFLVTTALVSAGVATAMPATAQDYGYANESGTIQSLTNPLGATITGAKGGVFADTGGIILTNAGTIRGNGTYDGLAAAPDGGVVISQAGSSVDNSGTISGAATGITTAHYYNVATTLLEPRAVGTTVTNSGTIIGDSNDGVRLIGGGTVTNSGAIRGVVGAGADGISMFALTGQNTTVLTSIGSVANLAGGTISGQRFGVILTGGGVVENAGAISGVTGAVLIQSVAGEVGKTAAVTNIGTMTGGDAVRIGGTITSATVMNGGSLFGSIDHGVHNVASGAVTVTNLAGGSIEGAKSGILGANGAVVVINAGTIRGNGTYDGFAASPDGGVVISQAGSSVENSGTISGASTGVTTINYLNPSTNLLEPRALGTTITNSGTIIGDSNDGVRLIGGGMVSNSGTIRGLVGAGADGISMFALQGQNTTASTSIGSVANAVGGAIAGQRFGIILSGGGAITNAGAISGNAGAVVIQSLAGEVGKTATIINSGTLSGGDAISIAGTIASASVTNSGKIDGSGAYGIHNSSAGTVTVTNEAGGVIEGTKSGIFGQNGAVVVNNSGTIIGQGSYDGFDAEPDSGIVLAIEGSSVVNSGTITGAGTGISTSHYYNPTTASLEPRAVGVTVTNSGTITGQSNDGVRLIGGGTVANSGNIQGLVGTGTDGISMFALNGQNTTGQTSIGSVANSASGTISGQRFGVILTGGGAVENAGAISGQVGAVLIQSVSGEVGRIAVVTNSGTMTGADAVRIGGSIASATVTNSGSLVGSVMGVHNIAPGTVTVNNLAGGSIVGAKSGIYGHNGAIVVTNAGTIRGDGTYDGFGAALDGGIVISQAGSSVDNSGTISSAGAGITTSNYLNSATNLLEPRAVGTVITNIGTIIGEGNDGVRLIGGGSVTNSGAIRGLVGEFTDGISMFALQGQNTTGQTSIGSVANSAGGIISGQRFGIILSGGGAVTNAGTISGATGSVLIQASAGEVGKTAIINNSGTLTGAVSAGANIASSSLVNSGTITGPVSLSLGNDSLTNEGRIDGDVSLRAGDDRLTLLTGSQVNGVIDGSDGNDIATLRGTSAVATVAQTVAQLANFEQLNVEQGYWTAVGQVGMVGRVTIGAEATLAVRELVTPARSVSPLVTASIVNNGLFVLDFDNTEMFDDIDALAISGTGGVRLEGEGIFTVGGSGLTYTGVTTVANGGLVLTGTLGGDVLTSGDGVFQIGDGGTTGDFTGDLVNNGSFIFNRSDDYGFVGDFSGTGDFAKMGAGTLTFMGDYGYTGITRILGGTVRFTGQIDPATEVDLQSGNLDISGTPQTVAELAGASGTSVVLEDSTLTINQDSNTAYAGVIAGNGSLVKDGDGRLNLTGTSVYSGATAINGGILAVNGSIVSDVTVNAGGTLGGTGTVADVTVGSGGTFAPGNSIGTIAVAGDIVFAAGSRYEVEVNAAGAADRINATGRATIAQGAGVSVLAEAGTYRPRTDYTILTAAGGVTGTFSTVTSNLAFLTPALAYGASAVTLRLYRNDIRFADVATSSNQANTGSAVQTLGIGNPLFEDALILNEAGARAAFDILSGEIHASVQSALTNDSRHVRDALLGVTRAGKGIGVWGSAVGNWGKADARNGAAGLGTEYRALITGVTFGGENVVAGVAAGRGSADYDAGARGSTAEVESNYLGAHLGYDSGRVSLKGGLALGWHDVNSRRSVAFATISQSPEASYDAATRQVFGEAAYGLDVSRVQLAPFARVAYIRTRTDGFAETAGSAALTANHQVQKVGVLNFGAHARGPVGADFQPRLSLSWQHGWGDLGGSSSARFADSVADFAVIGARLPRNALAIDGGFDMGVGRARLGASYVGSFSNSWSDHGVNATISIKF
ncbi:MAG: autotransporter domain-containing protein [Pseudomonadota bacterium]